VKSIWRRRSGLPFARSLRKHWRTFNHCMICFHDASLNKGRTNTKLIDRDFPHQVEMIGCSLESICYDLEGPFHVRFSPESRRVRCTGSCLLGPKADMRTNWPATSIACSGLRAAVSVWSLGRHSPTPLFQPNDQWDGAPVGAAHSPLVGVRQLAGVCTFDAVKRQGRGHSRRWWRYL